LGECREIYMEEYGGIYVRDEEEQEGIYLEEIYLAVLFSITR